MRVFVYEYLCAGGFAAFAGLSLPSEGTAMLSAVLKDFARCPGVQTSTLLDPRRAIVDATWGATIQPHWLRPDREEQTFRTLAATADFSLIIAPEFDDLLEQRCRWVEESGGHSLGPSSEAVRLTADKLTLACHLQAQGIPTPVVFQPSQQTPKALSYPLVCKPRFGAGSQATFLMHDEDEVTRAIVKAGSEGWSGELILQPYVPGFAVSVALLSGAAQLIALPAVQQQLSTDGRFHYRGGRLPLTKDLDQRARSLAVRAANAVKGLHGYFGIDLILGDAADGSADVVIEINPRLTTSYVGLRQLAQFNLAEAMLAIATDSRMPSLTWGTKTTVFRANGRILS
ncbi:MAG TPA: ATP-grasp domain-containing protein [Gemmataceae bacterium]|nr:ATP-grasp domain-containing protein [Gemmataceae bacterium]